VDKRSGGMLRPKAAAMGSSTNRPIRQSGVVFSAKLTFCELKTTYHNAEIAFGSAAEQNRIARSAPL